MFFSQIEGKHRARLYNEGGRGIVQGCRGRLRADLAPSLPTAAARKMFIMGAHGGSSYSWRA